MSARAVRDEVTKAVVDDVGRLLEGASEDVRTAIAETSDQMLRALAKGRVDLHALARTRFRTIAERNRVRASTSSARIVEASLSATTRFAAGLLQSGILTLADGIDQAAADLEDGLGSTG